MNQRSTGIRAAGITGIAVVIAFGASLLLDGQASVDLFVADVTVASAIRTLTGVLLFAVVAALGYRVATRRGESREYGPLLASLAIGGIIGSVGGLLLVESVRTGWTVPDSDGLELLVVVGMGTALHVALAGLVGATVAAFRSGRQSTT